jgi:uncharacterized protein YlxW (UPF0749 family)
MASFSLSVSILAGLLIAGAPAAVRAAGATTGEAQSATATANLQAERRKLEVDLQRANAEIEQLKKKDRGVRDDYRLRGRLADAEAMARRLTEIESQLNAGAGHTGSAAQRPLGPMAEPAPTDGPAELEARADILTDQSRRLEAQAATLTQRVAGLRSRIELRRRAGQLESDPFAPMEGAKRRLIAGVPGGSSPPANANAGSASLGPGRGGANSDTAAGGPSSGGAAPQSGPPPGASPVTQTPASGPTSPSAKTLFPTAAPAPSPGGGSGTSAGDSSASLSAQLRDFLDPSALAAIRKLEMAGTPVANLEALERAAAALKERAQKLQGQSNSLRERARTPR